MLDRMLGRTGRPLDELLQRAGSAQRGLPLFRARSPRLHLVACSPAIMRVPPDLPSATRVTGAWLDRTPPASLPADVEAFVADGPAPVVITFGSMGGGATDPVIEEAIAAILRGGRRVVLQGGQGADSPSLLRIGPIDHRALFPRAALVVHHGGAGTIHAVAAAGVPSVVVPHVGDQRYWADRANRLGVAPAPLLARGLTADALAQAVLGAAADPGLRQAAAALAEVVAAEDGVEAATALLERSR
jgi:UDP:flavonoid glycosyltransferase YjiC (YdhE family)